MDRRSRSGAAAGLKHQFSSAPESPDCAVFLPDFAAPDALSALADLPDFRAPSYFARFSFSSRNISRLSFRCFASSHYKVMFSPVFSHILSFSTLTL